MFYPFVEIFATYLEEFFLICISGLFFDKKVKNNTIYWILLLLLCSIFTGIVTYLNTIVLYSYLTLAIGILVSTIIIISLHRCDIVRACCLSVLYMVIVSSFDFLFLIFVEYVLKAPEFVAAVLKGNSIERVITLAISKSVLAIGYLWIKVKKRRVTLTIVTSIVLIVFAIFSFMSMQYLIKMFFMSKFREMQEVILVAGAFMTLFFLSILIILNSQEKVRQKANEKKTLERELRITKEHNVGIIETYREIAKVSHDYKNQMLVTVLMLKNGKVTEACNYLSGIVESSIYKIVEYTGISSIDTVLSEKKRAATEKDICMELDISLSSLCDIDHTDICIILLNLIDNAIEACLKIENEQDKKIKIILKNVNSMVLLKIENSVAQNINLKGNNTLLETTKSNKQSHGLGLKIVNSVAEKYNGSLVIKSENNIFTVTVLLSN